MTNKHKCMDCGKPLLSYTAKRCWNCYVIWIQIAKNHPNFKGGLPKCKICGKQLFNYDAIKCKFHANQEISKQNIGSKRKEITKQKIREKATGRKKSLKERKMISNRTKGTKNPFFGKRHTNKTKERIRQNTIKNMKKGIYSLKPNKKELILNRLLYTLFPKEYKYVGDAKVWIENFNPDFINCNGQKKIIELFGDYWHHLPYKLVRDKQRLQCYKKYGYSTLVVWERELKNLESVKTKIISFHKGL